MLFYYKLQKNHFSKIIFWKLLKLCTLSFYARKILTTLRYSPHIGSTLQCFIKTYKYLENKCYEIKVLSGWVY